MVKRVRNRIHRGIRCIGSVDVKKSRICIIRESARREVKDSQCVITALLPRAFLGSGFVPVVTAPQLTAAAADGWVQGCIHWAVVAALLALSEQQQPSDWSVDERQSS